MGSSSYQYVLKVNAYYYMFAEYKMFEYGADLDGNTVIDVGNVPNPTGMLSDYIDTRGHKYKWWMVSGWVAHIW